MIQHSSNRSVALKVVAIAALLGITGCAKPSRFQAPVGQFRDSSILVIQSTKVYLNALNKVERDGYIYGQAVATPPAQIKLDEIQQVQVFSPDGIAVRLKALDQLSSYVDLLYQLANSTAPDKIKADATTLQGSITKLSDQVASLTNEDDKQFKAAANKALPIIGQILQAFANEALESALKKAISSGAGPVNDLISAIESDATVAYERKKAAASAARVAVVDQYNREMLKGAAGDPAKLKAYADAISVEEDQWSAFLTAQPTAGLEAMKKANEALVKFAQTPNPNVTDFSSFVAAMQSFAFTANQISQAVQLLQK